MTFVPVVRNEDVSYLDDPKLALIKLCGSCEQPDTMVLTKEEFDQLPERLSRVYRVVSGWFESKTLLFLGYDLDDIDFAKPYEFLISGPRQSRHTIRGYFVSSKDTQKWRIQKLATCAVRLRG